MARPPSAAPAPAPAPAGHSALLDQLCAAAASSGLLILAALNPLSGGTAGHGDATHDRPNATERLSAEDDGGDAERQELEAEVLAEGDRRLEEAMNETWKNLRSPAGDPDDPNDLRDPHDPRDLRDPLQARLTLFAPQRLPILTNAVLDPHPDPTATSITASRPPWELGNLTTGGVLWCREDTAPPSWPGLAPLAVCG